MKCRTNPPWLLLVLCVLAGSAGSAAPSLIGQPAPDFALPAVAGSNVRLSEYRGQAVVLSFWSSHCSVCAAQLSALQKLYAIYHSAGLAVLAVSVDDDLQRAGKFAHAHTTQFPVLLDGSKSVGRDYGVDELPMTVLIDRDGAVRYVHRDYVGNDGPYVREIRALLDDASPTP